MTVGSDADLAIVDLDMTRRVTPELIHSHSDYSLYEGRTLRGWPVATFVRGQLVARDGQIVGGPGRAQHVPAP